MEIGLEGHDHGYIRRIQLIQLVAKFVRSYGGLAEDPLQGNRVCQHRKEEIPTIWPSDWEDDLVPRPQIQRIWQKRTKAQEQRSPDQSKIDAFHLTRQKDPHYPLARTKIGQQTICCLVGVPDRARQKRWHHSLHASPSGAFHSRTAPRACPC